MKIVPDFKSDYPGDIGGDGVGGTTGYYGHGCEARAECTDVGVQVGGGEGDAANLEEVRRERRRIEELLATVEAVYKTLATDSGYVVVFVASQCAAYAASSSVVSRPPAAFIGPYADFIAHIEAQQQELNERRRQRHAEIHRVLSIS
eukprot:TRINITY_DN43129_c0_g1_i1.p2 TRINITY_DN43129_c0_g1~~TRINITY_DN43129_c0_g1_i1.p2  ORF type:complete len:147 (+),score=35.62 TRINITY_DN43129_c0_g1_i1:200-640(+)